MFKYLVSFAAISCMLLFVGCGIVKGSKNPIIDKTIKEADKAYPDENLLEESIEEGIESITGLDLDLSPDSPEDDDENAESAYQ